jgi:serine/threonine protein kinase
MDEPAKQAMRLEPGSLFAGYRIDGLLDRGGMGVVYRATDVELDRTVALKIIAPEHTRNEDAVRRFKTEARLAASLEHPNIVPIHRGGEFDGVLYLAMRFVPGTNLRQLVDQGQLEMDRIQRVTASVAAALDAAHERGLVHRDVKPANILISGEGDHEHVYLTDFGLTKRLGSEGSLTRTGTWVGTPDYVAPEQIQAEKVDGRADVYSLGCVLYEMLTGSVAYPKDNDMAKLWAHVTDPPPAPSLKRPDMVRAFDVVVARATAKDPDERYQRASELAAAVERAVAEQASRSTGEGLQPTHAPAGSHEVFVAEPTQPPAEVPAGLSAEGTPPPRDTVSPPPQPPSHGPQSSADGGEPSRPEPGDSGRFARRRWAVVAGLAFLLGGVAAAVALISGSSDSGASREVLGDRVPATLGPVPTNRVNGQGTATVRLNGTLATVTLKTNGLLDRSPHVMHIHAGEKGTCPPVQAAREQNGHLSISTLAGTPFYGKPRVSLTKSGDIGVASILEFARYPKAGNFTYTRTIRLRPRTVRLIRSNVAGIVIHGIDYNGNGRYDDTLGGSDLNPALTAEATAPALCGELAAPRQQRAGKQHPNGSNVYRAALNVPPGAPWLCDLRLRA